LDPLSKQDPPEFQHRGFLDVVDHERRADIAMGNMKRIPSIKLLQVNHRRK